MSADKAENSLATGIGSLYSALPTEAKIIIAALLVFFFYVGGFTVLTKLPFMLESKCWELQVKDGRVFKFNACKGEVIELSAEDLKPKK